MISITHNILFQRYKARLEAIDVRTNEDLAQLFSVLKEATVQIKKVDGPDYKESIFKLYHIAESRIPAHYPEFRKGLSSLKVLWESSNNKK